MEVVSISGHLDRVTQQAASLRRDRSSARIAGVCSGLADATGIDINLLRICFVVLALSGGVGIALYLCMWLFVPQRGSDERAIARWFPRASQWEPRSLGAFTLTACLAMWLLLGSWTPFGITPVVVMAVLFAVAQRQRSRGDSRGDQVAGAPAQPSHAMAAAPESFPPVALQPGPFQQATDAWQQRLSQVTDSADPDQAWTPEEPTDALPHGPIARTGDLSPADRTRIDVVQEESPHEADVRRPRGWLAGLLTVLVSAGTGWATYEWIEAANPAHRATLALAATLGVLAVALIAAGIAGRRLRLVGLAGIVTCLWLGGLQLGVLGPESQAWAPRQDGVGTVASPYQFVSTQATVDLTKQAATDIHLDARASTITIVVPADRDVTLTYTARMCDLELPDSSVGGTQTGTETWTAQTPTTEPPLTVTLNATMSKVVITRG